MIDISVSSYFKINIETEIPIGKDKVMAWEFLRLRSFVVFVFCCLEHLSIRDYHYSSLCRLIITEWWGVFYSQLPAWNKASFSAWHHLPPLFSKSPTGTPSKFCLVFCEGGDIVSWGLYSATVSVILKTVLPSLSHCPLSLFLSLSK